MKKEYNHKTIEKKWQQKWDKTKAHVARILPRKKKFYGLIEFPYPSGDGLHVGHVRSNTAMDIIARKRRAEGYNVLYPIGWDAFGLPTENYAIKTGKAPSAVTKKNTDTFRRQLKSLGFSFDWSREINTTDPAYYKWTQWIFLQFFKKGLAYKAKMPINWCLSCKIGLANEEVIDGACERCGGPTEKREKEQWMLAITKYADRLDKDLDMVDYIPAVKTQQRNWIGKSSGSEISFAIRKTGGSDLNTITVFTTRADTLFGATYIVIAPEHELLTDMREHITNWPFVSDYRNEARKKSDIERTNQSKEKTGVKVMGIEAINPATGEALPVYIADYVLSTYGTGAIMAVPSHDERDHAFAKKFDIKMREVVVPNRVDKENPPVKGKLSVARQNVQAIVRNPHDNTFLALKSLSHNWITFPMGGVESGEDIVDAAKREVEEETGYKNLKFVKVLGGMVRAEYFAAHKNQNRIAFTNAVLFDLVNDERSDVVVDEAGEHEILWLDRKQLIYPHVVHAELNDWLQRLDKDEYVYTEDGILIDSGDFTGMSSLEARNAITKFVGGKKKTTYKLRDWVFSRQRYWGEPIPIIKCESCGYVPVPEKDLPVKLPVVAKYTPTDSGESPLAGISSWVTVKCPNCKRPAKRETDTMPNWAGSSWYFLRYTDPKNTKEFASKKALKYFTPVDWYNGGMEHTTLHLLYSRFWHKFLYDLKLVPTSEPYLKRTSHGLILADKGVKMSKSKGNVINPDDIVKVVGADTLRLYEMFMGPFDQAIAWSTESMAGCRRFIERIWKLQAKVAVGRGSKSSNDVTVETLLHQTIKKVSEDIENLRMNTAVSALMVFSNELEKQEQITSKMYETLLRLLAPFIPHVTEELWEVLGHKKSIHFEKWPSYDVKKLVSSHITIGVLVNGKVRGSITISKNASETEAIAAARKSEAVAKWLQGDFKKLIYVPGKILSIVV